MVTHIVLFKFENLEIAQEAVKRLLSMKGRVPALQDIEAGVDFTRSERSFEVGLITRHASREDLLAYQVDPIHVEVASYIKANAKGAAAVDFE